MAARINALSRLIFGDYRVIDGVEFWDLLELPTIEPQRDDIYHTLQSYERIDNIAYRYYDNPTLWWVIAVANDIELVPFGMTPGTTLRIPSSRYIFQVYLPSVGS